MDNSFTDEQIALLGRHIGKGIAETLIRQVEMDNSINHRTNTTEFLLEKLGESIGFMLNKSVSSRGMNLFDD